jgi:hypothetical protein
MQYWPPAFVNDDEAVVVFQLLVAAHCPANVTDRQLHKKVEHSVGAEVN